MSMALLFITLVLAHLPLQLNAFNLTATQVCGFDQKRTGNISNFEQRKESCCRSCERTGICKEKDTCCSDIDSSTGYENITKQECIPASYTPKGRHPIGLRLHYFARVRCPATFTDVKVKEKCEGGIPEKLDDVIFVSSEDGTVVYKNRFCGLCHGEQKIIPWETMIEKGCLKMIVSQGEYLYSGRVVELILKVCKLIYERPEVASIKSVLCHVKSAASECNSTRTWKIYDSRLENLCHDPLETFEYYHETRSRTVVYRNVYCYLCNGYNISVPKKCYLQALDSSRFGSYLSLLISPKWYAWSHKKQEVKEAGEEDTCREGMIFDTFLGVCQNVYCPAVSILIDGECEQFVEKQYNYRFDLRLDMEKEIEKLDLGDNYILYLYNFILKLIKFSKCTLCHRNMSIQRGNRKTVSDIYVTFFLTPTRKYKKDYILSNVARLETSNFSATINFRQHLTRFVGYVQEARNWNVTRWQQISMIGDSLDLCPALLSDRRSNCPKIKLTPDEYDTIVQNHSRAKELLFLANPDDENGTVYVCLDKYFEKPRGVGVVNHMSLCTVIALVATVLRYFMHVN